MRNLFARLSCRLVLLVVTLVPFCGATVFAQAHDDAVFADVPEVARAQMIERLNLLVEYQKTQQWAKQYDLFSSKRRRSESKRDFINNTRLAYSKWGRTPLLSFTPLRVALVQVDANQRVWFIAGCSQVLDKGRKVNNGAFVEAHWERNNWYFSEVENIGPSADEDGPCPRLTAGK